MVIYNRQFIESQLKKDVKKKETLDSTIIYIVSNTFKIIKTSIKLLR